MARYKTKNYYQKDDDKPRGSTGVTAVKAIAIIISLALAAYLALALVFASWNPVLWTEVRKQQIMQNNPEATDGKLNGEEVGGGLIVEEGEAKGVKMEVTRLLAPDFASYNVSPQALEAYTVTATVYDEAGQSYEAIQDVVYSLSGSAASSIKLTQDGTTATLECLQAFGSEITLTCTSTINPEVKATRTLGYYKSIESLNCEIQGNSFTVSNGGVVTLSMPSFASGVYCSEMMDKVIKIGTIDNFGIGTATATLTVEDTTVKATESFRGIFATERKAASVQEIQFPCTGTYSARGNSSGNGRFYDSVYNLFECCVGDTTNFTFMNNQSGRAAVFRALAKSTNQFEVTVKYNYNGKQILMTFYINIVDAVAPQVASMTYTDGSDKIMFNK